MSEMEIAFEPYRKLSFRSYLQFDSPEALVRAITLNIAPGIPAHASLRWANGVVFSVANFQPADSVVKEYVAGHLLWDHIDFASMPQYQSEIRIPEKPLVTVNVLSLTGHTIFDPLTEWIRDNLLRKASSKSKR